MNQTNLSTTGEVFEKGGLSHVQVEYWNNVQADYNKLGFIFIEYELEYLREFIWRCYLEHKTSLDAGIKNKTQRFDGDFFNTELIRQFIDQGSYSNQYWESFMNNVKWSGYFIPVDDFSYFTNPEMKSELNHSYHLCQHFKAADYLRSVKKDSIETHLKNEPIAVLGIWNSLVFYADFLLSCYENEEVNEKPNPQWHTRNVSFTKFRSHLPSRQISTLLFITLEMGYLFTANKSKIDGLLKQSHHTVRSFFSKYQDAISLWINKKEGVLFSDDMKMDFINCCREDHKIITALEVLDSTDSNKFQEHLQKHLLNKLDQKKSLGFFARIRKSISQIYLLDILWFDTQLSSAKPRRYIPKLNRLNFTPQNKWYNIPESLIDEIEEESKKFPPDTHKILNDIVIKKWSTHLVKVANIFSPPIFIWEIKFNKTVPQWNILSNKSAKKNQDVFYKKQENIAEQRRRLKQYIFQLQKLRTIEAIEQFKSTALPFFDPTLDAKWKQNVEKHSRTITGTQGYRERRMKELGIKNEDGTIDYRTDIWLDEMLKIEEEVRSYIPFVKKAFIAALPIRKTVEFNNDRHDFSGIEFDPSTINDQNKWLRGEVMKTLKSKTKLGEIEQINAFCLDYSGSMDHTRMRNLFKILYLLVLGLEDRKSYDAFHFFNSNFIEGSNFTEEFTRRKLLFKILSKVSEISDGSVMYGGFIGTNIGEGVLECHNRIHSFKNKIALKKPSSGFVCSMFVITDGEPSVGITDLKELNQFIKEKRIDGDIAIKGIYIKSEEDENNFMESIFGGDEFVETVEFGEAVNKFVTIMTNTYKAQRKAQKWKIRQELLKGNN